MNNSHARSELVHGAADFHTRPPYDIVRLTLRTDREGPFEVHLSQPLVEEIPYERIEFISEYYGEDWTYREGRIEFTHELDGTAPLVTAFAAKNVDRTALEAMVRALSVEIRDADGNVATELHGPSLVAEDDDGHLKSVEPDRPAAAAADEEDEVADVDTPEESGVETTDHPDRDDESEPAADESDAGSFEQPAVGEDAPPRLPANVTDYVLGDVAEEIESAEEFEWTTVDESATSNGSESTGLLDRVRSFFAL